jgi:hypothetical protein
VHTDVLYFDALCFQFPHHGIGFLWTLKVEGVTGHPRPGTVLGVEQAQPSTAYLKSLYVAPATW